MRTGMKTLCPGYLSREDEKLIRLDPSKASEARCALCGTRIEAVYRAGEWVLRIHTARREVILK